MTRENPRLPDYHPSQKALEVLNTLVQGVVSIHISAAMEMSDEDLKSQASYWQTKFSEKFHSLEGAEIPYFHTLQSLITNSHDTGEHAMRLELKRHGLGIKQIRKAIELHKRYLEATAQT